MKREGKAEMSRVIFGHALEAIRKRLGLFWPVAVETAEGRNNVNDDAI